MRRLTVIPLALAMAVTVSLVSMPVAAQSPPPAGPDADALALAAGLPRCVDGVSIVYAGPSSDPVADGPEPFDEMTSWVTVLDAGAMVGADLADTWGSFGQSTGLPDAEHLSFLAWSDPTGDGARWLEPLTTTTRDDPYVEGEFDIERYGLGSLDVVDLSLPESPAHVYIAATGPWVYYVAAAPESLGQQLLATLPRFGTDAMVGPEPSAGEACDVVTGTFPVPSGDPFEAIFRDDLAGGTYIVVYQACPGARIEWVPDATDGASPPVPVEIVSEQGPRFGQVMVDLPAGPGSFQGVRGCDFSSMSWSPAPGAS